MLVKDIELYSMCEHHLLPFMGKAHVAYIPDGKVIGLSKVARMVDVFARRLQIQENLTTQIADALMQTLHPSGVAVVIEAKHLCMMMRGVEKQNSVMKTSCLLGSFKEDARTRAEFLALLASTVRCFSPSVNASNFPLHAVFSIRLVDRENLAAFGDESAARYGTGRNYVAYFVFSGDQPGQRDADEHQRNQSAVVVFCTSV